MVIRTMRPIKYYQMIIDRGGGIITLGEHLGVFVSDNPINTPPGWLFVNIKNLTVNQLAQWVDEVRDGRKSWPEKIDFTGNKRKRRVL